MRYALIALALACFAAPAFAQKTMGEPEDAVMGYHETDARMNAAIEQARATLPLFFEEFRHATTQGRGAFTIKAGLPTAGGSLEHIWIGELRFEGDNLVGALINEPYDLPGMRLGSRVVVSNEAISDWSINTPQGIYGAFTTRVMIADMPTADAAQYNAVMAPTPLPPGWTQ